MKVAVIGDGNVGRAVYRELQNVANVNEIVLVGRKRDRLKAEIDDYLDAIVLRGYSSPRLSYGGYEATEGADILLYCAGSGKMDSDRMEMLEGNCQIAKSIFEQVNEYNRDGIVICLTNPVDVITMQVAATTGRDRSKVFGTGTLLDSARLTRYVSELLEISSHNANMLVLGEHGNSSVALISSFRVAGMTLDEYLSAETGVSSSVDVDKLNASIRDAAYRIIKGKGYTNYGVAAAACALVSAIAGDTRQIFPASVLLQGEYGEENVAASVPVIVGRHGIEAVKNVKMTEREEADFHASVDVIRSAAHMVGLR